MAKIVFAGDHEEGNMLASLGLAKQLRDHGHEICYVGVPDAKDLILREGIGFFSILGSAYPTGSKYTRGRAMSVSENRNALCGLFFRQADQFDALMKHLLADLLILPPYLPLESLLLHLRYGVPVAHFRNAHCIQPRSEAIRQGCIEVLEESSYGDDVTLFLTNCGVDCGTNLEGLIGRILKFPELVALPPRYERCEGEESSNCLYVGPLVDLKRTEDPFDWSTVPKRERLLFCSLGSQSDRDLPRSQRFFQMVLDAMDGQQELSMVLSIGKGTPIERFAAPSNVFLSNWVSQIQMLECILHRVPMLAYPHMRDQFASAEAIVRHGLGLSGNIDSVTPAQIREHIHAILDNSKLVMNMDQMYQQFIDCERSQHAVRIVENLLDAWVSTGRVL
jgi:zeaxanthin glucosyltransferase